MYSRGACDVGVSVVTSGQPLIEASSCRIVWNETQSSQQSELTARLLKIDTTANSPLKKRPRVMMDRLAAALTAPRPSDVPEEHGRGVIDPGHSICLAVSANPCPPGQEVTLVGTWREGIMGRKVLSEDLAQVVIDSDLVCRGGGGGGQVHRHCLDLWQGTSYPFSFVRCDSVTEEARIIILTMATINGYTYLIK